MKKEKIISGKWSGNDKSIEISLPLIQFNEDDVEIIFCPALDLSGYGKDENEALDSFYTVIFEFFRYTTNKETLSSELVKLGWKIKKSRAMIAPKLSTLLETNKDFNRIFNTHSFKKIDRTIAMPAFQ